MFGPGAILDSFQSSGAAPKLLRGDITYAEGSTGAIGATTLFTVTGDVLVTMLAAKCTTDLTSAGAPGLEIGVVGNTSLFTGSLVDPTGWDSGEWADGNSGVYRAGGGEPLFESSENNYPISANIIQTIASATITGGVVRWYLQYVPLSGDGLVTLHANLTAF